LRSEDNGVIRETVLRRLKRDGQVYFSHNGSTPFKTACKLEEILPEAIAVAHVNAERELEEVMKDFVAQRFNDAAVLDHH
jgi:transcription-repair coupling factor (superfamily II helicase)